MQASDPARVEAIIKELVELSDRITGTMFRLTAKQMDRGDLSSNRFNALRALRGDEELTMSGLAERLRVSTAAVTSIVDKLEAEGLVRRSRSKTDRRQIFVHITQPGTEAVQQLIDIRADLFRYMIENVSPEMQHGWLELSREMCRLLDKRVAESQPETEVAQ
jgi:DNA-binding MarR family transcriptional regulator